MFDLYSNDYYYVAFEGSNVKNIFSKFSKINRLNHSLNPSNYLIKEKFKYEKETFNIIFNNPKYIKIGKYNDEIVYLGYYKVNDFIILEIVNKNKLDREMLLSKLKIFNNFIVKGIIIYEKQDIVDYYFEYKELNKRILDCKFKNNIKFLDFFGIFINKGNLKIRKNKHFF